MGAVVAMLHGGLRCAIPAQQVLFAEAARASDRRTALWPGAPSAAGAPSADAEDARAPQRDVRVATEGGVRSLGCSRPRLVLLDRASVWSLPPLLDELLAMPHVVGLAEIEGALHWLIDARHLPDGAGDAHA